MRFTLTYLLKTKIIFFTFITKHPSAYKLTHHRTRNVFNKLEKACLLYIAVSGCEICLDCLTESNKKIDQSGKIFEKFVRKKILFPVW